MDLGLLKKLIFFTIQFQLNKLPNFLLNESETLQNLLKNIYYQLKISITKYKLCSL